MEPRLFKSFVNGGWEPGRGQRATRNNPATGELIGSFSGAMPREVDDAIAAAHTAFPSWRDTPVEERVAIVERVLQLATDRQNDLAAILRDEAGKPMPQALGETKKGLEVLAHAIKLGRDPKSFGFPIESATPGLDLSVELHPYGVTALITAWNFPWILFLWKAAYALIAGNTIVWKPALQTPWISSELVKLFTEAGLPPGVLNMVYGGVDVGEQLVLDPRVEVVSFTGSTKAGFRIAELNYVERFKRGVQPCVLLCEMGGKNAAVVMPDADLDHAIRSIVSGAFWSGGQRCTATGRVIVHKDVAHEFTDRLITATQDLKVGLPTEDGVLMGPLVDETHMDRVLGFVERARGAGFTIAEGGNWLTSGNFANGWFVEPTIVTGVTRDSEIAREEVFGPVLPVIVVESFDEAMEVVNGTHYGLKGAIFTADEGLQQRFVQEARVGGAHINDPTAGAFAATPFGGTPNTMSAIGLQECGPDAMRPYQRTVSVYRNTGNVAQSASR